MFRVLTVPCRHPVQSLIALMAVAGAIALLLGSAVARAAVDDDATTPAARAELESELKNARDRLDDAARDVAELTRKLYGDQEHEVMRFIGNPARGAMLGVNIDSDGTSGEGVRIAGVSPGGPAATAGQRTPPKAASSPPRASAPANDLRLWALEPRPFRLSPRRRRSPRPGRPRTISRPG